MSGVKYHAIYHNTTIDPPQTIKYCKDNGVEVIQPKRSFLELIKWGGFPNRFYRFCCHYLKEIKMDDYDYVLLGIRADESNKRKARYTEPEQCRVFSKTKKERQYFPILQWTLQDVKDFIVERGIKLHPLYYDDNGELDVSQRLGCLGCPLASRKKRIEEFKKHPKLLNLYVRGGQQYLDNHADSKTAKRHRNVYEWLVDEIFCLSHEEFLKRFGPNLFGEGVDCKKFLEEYFKVKLK